jgi:hypothetical protein
MMSVVEVQAEGAAGRRFAVDGGADVAERLPVLPAEIAMTASLSVSSW